MDGMEQVATFNALLQRKSWVLDEADWALMAAAMHGHSCYLRPLLAAGATATRFYGVPGSTGDRFIRDTKEQGRVSLVGLTALLVAAERGHHEVVKELVRAGSLEDDSGLIHRAVEVNAGSAVDGTTALMFCVRGAELSRWQQGDVEVVRALLKADADLEARDAEGSTALIHAAKAGATFAQIHCWSGKFLSVSVGCLRRVGGAGEAPAGGGCGLGGEGQRGPHGVHLGSARQGGAGRAGERQRCGEAAGTDGRGLRARPRRRARVSL